MSWNTCEFCRFFYNTSNEVEEREHEERHAAFEEARRVLGFLPANSDTQERQKSRGNYLLASKAVRERYDGALLILRGHFDRSLESAIIDGYWRKHPSYEEYVAMAFSGYDFDEAVQKLIEKAYGRREREMDPDSSYWTPPKVEDWAIRVPSYAGSAQSIDSGSYGTIYCIGALKEGAVKIGFTGKIDPTARIKSLQVGNPKELFLLASFSADALVEKKLHRLLSIHSVRGEWFDREPGLALVRRLESGYSHDTSFPFELTLAMDGIRPLSESLVAQSEFIHTSPLLLERILRDVLHRTFSDLQSVNTRLPLPLLAWLSLQVERNDPIGDLAKDARRDASFPKAGSLKQYLSYVDKATDASHVLAAVLDAWVECDSFVKNLVFDSDEQ